MTLQGYDAIRAGAAIGATAERRQLAVTGADRAAYLQGLLTNDLLSLTAGGGCYAAWLSPQGRMLTDMHVLESGEMILLDLPEATLQATHARLDQFIFSEDVQVSSLADSLSSVWLHGPGAAALLRSVLSTDDDLASWPLYRHAQRPHGGDAVSVVRLDQLGVPGFCAYVEAGARERLIESLRRAGAVAAAPGAIDAARVEAAYPIFGVDMTDDTIPLEAGIEHRAISFSKGCYVGQEVVIRILHRGHGRVARRLVSLQLSRKSAARGDTLHAADREVGFLTSVAVSPRHGGIALGYVHRDFTAPGTALAEATVIEPPGLGPI